MVEIDVKERGPTFEIATNMGVEEMDVSVRDMLGYIAQQCPQILAKSS